MPRPFDDAFELCDFFFCLLSVCLQENVFFIPFHTIIYFTLARVRARAHHAIFSPKNPSIRHNIIYLIVNKNFINDGFA